MSNQLSKFLPHRTIALRGFDALGASAALHSATATGFTVSGTFRDSADFTVLMLWDADNFYEHPRLKYLPDFDFTGGVLQFDVIYASGVHPIDSPQSNWIDWATLDYIPVEGSPGKLRLWDNCMLKSGAFTAASATFHLKTTAEGIQPNDHVTIFFQSFYFDYQPSPNPSSIEYLFFASTANTHSITVNSRLYEHTITNPAGETSAEVAASLIALVNAGAGDPDVIASVGSTSYAVLLTARPGHSAAVDASGNGPASLGTTSLNDVAVGLAKKINTTNWWTVNPTQAVRATVDDNKLTITAARYGIISVTDKLVKWTSGAVFSGLKGGDTITIYDSTYTIASVESPTSLTLNTSTNQSLTDTHYVADRGGSDGNLLRLYALSARQTLTTEEPDIHLTGGNSEVTWTCTIDFSKYGLTALRQCWFTYAAPLADGAAFPGTEWYVTYTNWRFTGPDTTTRLWVAGPGSVRIEENSPACQYTGAWATPSPETGFFSGGLARRAGTTDPLPDVPDHVTNETLTVRYTCASVHDLYLGTSFYVDRANIWISLDGGPEFAFSLYLKTVPAVNTRRRIRPNVPAGSHTVKFRLKDPGYFYFDFLEAAVLSDVPSPAEAQPNLSPALDYSTDHSWKLPPARILWILDNLGFTGPVNQYIGVFWWNQRTNPTARFASAQVTFPAPVPDTSIFLNLGGFPVRKDVFAGDTATTVAKHFAAYMNAAFVGIWAAASGPTLTITVRSPAYSFTFTSDSVSITGSLDSKNSNLGTWMVDPTQSPALNRGARDWHADLYRECALRTREITTAGSMELVNPPEGFAACYPDGKPVITSVGFASLYSTHCAQSSPMRAYQQSVFDCVADLQNAAGLIPNFQMGEYLWWFFSSTAGMAYYDAETASAAQTALGRPLHKFLTPNDDPSVNGSADALFLRARLRDHVKAIVAHIRSRYPNAVAEVLFAYDVNYPTMNSDIDGSLGGALNRFINFPAEWGSSSTAGFDRLKVEALAFGSRFRNLNLAKSAIEFPLSQDWPLNKIRYLAPIFTHSSSWRKEVHYALNRRIPIVNLWAFDQMNIFGLKIGRYHNQSRSLKMG